MGLRALTSGERRCIIITDNNYHYHRSSFVLITKRVISVFFSSAICQDHVGYYFRRHKRIIDTLLRAADKIFKHRRKCLSQISYCLRLCTPICVSGSLLLAAVLLRVGNPPSHSSYLLADCISILGSPPGHPLPPVAVPPPTCTR